MKPLIILIASFILLSNYSLLAQDYKEEISKYLQKEMKEQKIPGLQIIVIRNNEIILSETLGLADVAFSVPVNENTIFSINSISKVFASTAIMQLVEKDKIQISHPISNYINELPADWQKITVKQLLSHTSGLPDIEDQVKGGLIGGKGQDYAWDKVQKMPLQFKAGEDFSYNATNYLLIQKIIEKYSGISFEEFVQKNQFDIVGINKIKFGNSFDVIENKSSTYSYYSKHKVSNKYIKGDQLLEIYEEFPPMLRADAGAFSTAGEMAKWIIALQAGKFLKNKESINTMWEPVKLNNGKYDGFGGFLNAYAFGWPVIKRENHSAVAPIGGGRASFIIYPKDNLGIILFTNLTGSSPQKIIENISKFYLSS